MATPARLAGIGVFVVGGLALFALGLFMIGDRQMAFAKRFTVYTEFTKVTGLQPGAVVRVLGAKAGSVKQIVPPNSPGQKFRVRLEIAESLHQLVRTDSIATIETEGLVGGSYLGIGTGTDAAPQISRDGTIAGKEPFEISDLVQQMGDSITKVNATIDTIQGDVQNAVLAVSSTMGNANALITDVSGDVKKMAASGARITDDASRITEGLRRGDGVIGKLMTDDELYRRATAIAAQTEETASNVRQVVELAKKTLEGFQANDGPVRGLTADLRQTLDGARAAMVGFAENMNALKRNFLVRGFFNRRGYFDLDEVSPAAYRKGVLTKDGRQLARVWLRSDALFEPQLDDGDIERLTDAGKTQLDSAFAPSLENAASGVVIVEGYAQEGPLETRFLRSRARASVVRDYLLARFFLDAQTTGAMPLGADSPGSPGLVPWDGVAIAVILPKGTITGKGAAKAGPSARALRAD
jgi:phospholipid/cholesterol/gamma-HCH transport system substrate-binding protein